MRFTTKVTSLVAAGGAAALGVGLLAFAPGVGAAFTDSASANANIAVGTFGCELSSLDSSVTISTDHKSATVDLGTISSSLPGTSTAQLMVTNTGSIPVTTSWTASIVSGNLSSHFSPTPAPGSAVLYGTGDTQTVDIGFQWTTLTSDDLGDHGTAKYTVTCNETGFALFQRDGGTAAWEGDGVTVTSPSSGGAGAGITILGTDSTLPAHEPTFITDVYRAGTPRFVITFDNGEHAFGYPAQANPASWEVQGPGGFQGGTWSQVQDYVTSTGVTVTNAFVVLDTSGGAQTAHITCVNYSGTALFGTC